MYYIFTIEFNFPGLQQAEGDQVVGPDDAWPELQRDRGKGGQRMGAAAGKHLILYLNIVQISSLIKQIFINHMIWLHKYENSVFPINNRTDSTS